MQRQTSYKTISYRELSDPLCDSVNRGLTLVRLAFILYIHVFHPNDSNIKKKFKE